MIIKFTCHLAVHKVPRLLYFWVCCESVLGPNQHLNQQTQQISRPSFVSFIQLAAAAAAKSLQSCSTLCDPREDSPPGSPVPGILQARTLEWVAISFSNHTVRERDKNKRLSELEHFIFFSPQIVIYCIDSLGSQTPDESYHNFSWVSSLRIADDSHVSLSLSLSLSLFLSLSLCVGVGVCACAHAPWWFGG